jgi:hypothetical protein
VLRKTLASEEEGTEGLTRILVICIRHHYGEKIRRDDVVRHVASMGKM